jgi:hypothetical protein
VEIKYYFGWGRKGCVWEGLVYSYTGTVIEIHLICHNSWKISLEQFAKNISDYSDVYHNSQKG